MEQTKERTMQEWSETKVVDRHASTRADTHAPLRLLIIAPSHDILGGQSVHAAQLVKEFGKEPALRVSFMHINQRAPGFLIYLKRVKFICTITTSLIYLIMLLNTIPRNDVLLHCST